jgi:hypothetical protein
MPVTQEQMIAEAQARTGRSCGTCSMCCKLLKIPELEKEQDAWCRHCNGHGCSIYETRPQVCRNYACAWLTMPNIGDEWFPKTCGMLLDLGMHEENGIALLRVHVDEQATGRWREEPYHSQLRKMAAIGLARTEKNFQTVVSDAGRKWIILPDREVDAGKPGLLVRKDDGRFEFTECASTQEMHRLGVRKVIEACCDRAMRERPDSKPNEIIKRMAELLEERP